MSSVILDVAYQNPNFAVAAMHEDIAWRHRQLEGAACSAGALGHSTMTVPVEWVEDGTRMVTSAIEATGILNPSTIAYANIQRWNNLADYVDGMYDFYHGLPDLIAQGADFVSASSETFLGSPQLDMSIAEKIERCDPQEHADVDQDLVAELEKLHGQAEAAGMVGRQVMEVDVDVAHVVGRGLHAARTLATYHHGALEETVEELEDGVNALELDFEVAIEALRNMADYLKELTPKQREGYGIDTDHFDAWLLATASILTPSELRLIDSVTQPDPSQSAPHGPLAKPLDMM